MGHAEDQISGKADRSTVAQNLEAALQKNPESARQLVIVLRAAGLNVTKADVNSVLYADGGRFQSDQSDPAHWRVIAFTMARTTRLNGSLLLLGPQFLGGLPYHENTRN